MIFDLNSDELLLVIIGIVRRINPAMLKAEGDGFTVDFTPLQGKKELSSDEELLVKLRAAAEAESTSVNLEASEARQLSTSLERLEKIQNWPADVLDMSRALRSKLSTVV
jgi:hypothetical protein